MRKFLERSFGSDWVSESKDAVIDIFGFDLNKLGFLLRLFVALLITLILFSLIRLLFFYFLLIHLCCSRFDGFRHFILLCGHFLLI